MKLSLSRLDQAAAPWLAPTVAESLRAVAASLGEADDSIDLVVVDDAFIQRINRDYRGKDRPTDVISFSYIEDAAVGEYAPRDNLAGEIYISRETLEREAKEQGIEPQYLFMRLGVHGMLHVLGFEHGDDEQAHRMEQEERRLLLEHVSQAHVDTLF